MNHLDFVLWVIGWGFFIAHTEWTDEATQTLGRILMFIVWFLVSGLLWFK